MIIYDLSISKKWANLPESEYIIYVSVPILFEYLKMKSKLQGSKSTIHPCYHNMTWASQKSEQISQVPNIQCTSVSISCFEYLKIKSKLLRSKSTIHPCYHISLEHLQKVSKSLRERIYKTHLCPYLVRISQNRKQITRELNRLLTLVITYDSSISKQWANLPGSE